MRERSRTTAARWTPVGGPPTGLDRAAVETLLPHGEGALLVDHVPWFEPGREAIGVLVPIAAETRALPLRADNTVAPELLIEGLAQLAGILVTSITETPQGPTPAWLAGLRRVRLIAPAPAHKPLSARVRFARRLGRLLHLSGEVFCGAAKCVEGTLTLALA